MLQVSSHQKLLAVNLNKILKDEISASPQPAKGSSYYSKNSIDFKNLKIELSATAEQIKNQIRAYSFPEFQVPKIHGYFVNSSKITEVKSTKKFGSIISVNPSFLVISTVDYDLDLIRDKNFELLESAGNNNLGIAIECVENGADVNTRKGNGWTPLIQ